MGLLYWRKMLHKRGGRVTDEDFCDRRELRQTGHVLVHALFRVKELERQVPARHKENGGNRRQLRTSYHVDVVSMRER